MSKNWGLNIKDNAIGAVSKILAIAKNMYPDCQKILIPAFDYKPFITKRINTEEIRTEFAFASILLASEAKDKIDIIYDPVFSYISYPGEGRIIGNENTVFKPFNNPNKFLSDNDIIAFTKKAFEPSHLMQIENILFGQSHPYRYNKMFLFTNFDARQIEFNYMVRPKDDRLTEYDLNKIYSELKNKGALIKGKDAGLEYISFKNLKDYVMSTCRSNPYGLLTVNSQKLIHSVAENARIPNSYFA